MIESTVENYLRKRVKETGGEVRKLQWVGRRGAPDRFVFWPHAHAFVELKRPGGEPEEHQMREIRRLRDAKLPVFVLSAADEVDNFIWSMTGR